MGPARVPTRKLLIGVAIAITVLVALLLLWNLPLSASEPQSEQPMQAYPADGPQELEVTLERDGETLRTASGALDTDGTLRMTVTTQMATSEQYLDPERGSLYGKTTYEDPETALRRAESADSDINRTVLEHDEETVIVRNDNPEDAAFHLQASVSWATAVLNDAAYDTVEETDRHVVHELRSDWYETNDRYRLSDAFGTVYTEADGYGVTNATVSWNRVHADSYYEYGIERLFGGGTHESLQYERSSAPASVDRPEWVPDEA